MATDFTYGGKQIVSGGPFKPGGKDMPSDARTRVDCYADIATIPNPYVGLKITVKVDETNNNKMTDYIVKSLKANSLGIANSLIDEVVRYVDYLGVNTSGSSGEGLTTEQAQHLQTAYLHSQSTHVQASDIPSLEGYATETFVTNNYASKNHNHSEYASSSHRHDASEIDNLPSGGGVSQEDINTAVNNYLTEHPVAGGATTEQAAQIQANKTAIGDSNSGLIKEVNDIKNTELQNLNTAIQTLETLVGLDETVGDKNGLPSGDANIIASINRIDSKTSTGTGLTSEQAQQLQTAYEHSQSVHVNSNDIPTKISQLENDSKFVTQTQLDNVVVGAGGFAVKNLSTSEISEILSAISVIVPVESITASTNYLSINVGETRQITYNILPANATDKTVVYSSSDDSKLTVDQEGNIEAIASGDFMITLTCSNGVKTDCQVVVNEVSQQVDVTSITLNKTNLQLNLNEAITLTATVLPQNATNKSVTWESSNTNIAAVINGVVTGINNGSCIITCKSVSNPTITQTCNVTVQEIVTLTRITDGLQHSYDFTNLNGDSTSVSDLTGNVPATLTGFSDVTSAKTVYGIVTGTDKTGTIIQGNMSSITGKYTIAITLKGLRTNSQGIYHTAGVKFNTINSSTPYFCYTEGGFLQQGIYSPFSEDTFVNVISVFDYETNTITTYIDGELIETTATTTKTWTNSITLGNGYWGGANSICFKNMVIYNRCITATEAKTISSDLMPVKFLGVNTQNTSLPLTNSLVDHFSCTGTLTDTNLLSLVSNTSLSNVASNSNTDGFVLSKSCEIPNSSYINFSCFVKFNYDSTLPSNQFTIICDDGKASLNVYISNGKLYAKTSNMWLLDSTGAPINLNNTDNVLQISVNRLTNTISFYFDNVFLGEQTNNIINFTVFYLANTNIPVKDIVLYNGILSESDRSTVYNSLLGISSTTLLTDGDAVITRNTTNSIVGIMEAIVSPSNTSERQVITLPFNIANSIYFGDGKTLQQKFDNGELGSSGTNNKWYGKNIVCLGDSITASGYPTYIGEVLGAFINNQGSSGGTYARDFDIIQNIDWTYVDAVTYMTGQNSAGGGTITLAESGLMDVTDWTDYSSYPNNYYGGVAKVINYIRAANPNIKIYLLGQANSGVLPLTSNYPYLIRQHMMELSMFLSVPFIDTFCHAGIDFRNWNNYSTDGVHINEEGKKLVGRNAAYEMMYL